MTVVTVYLPDPYLDCMEILTKQGWYPSRSEIVREAIKRFLGKETLLAEDLNMENFEQLKQDQLNAIFSIQKNG